MPSRRRRAPGAPMLKRNVSDLRALAHPLRLRMMELFAESPKTTKQVAELLGQPPTRLYHHVAALERAGLLVLREKRQNRGAVEKWYEGVSRQVQGVQTRAKQTTGKGNRRAVAATILEQARQELMNVPAGDNAAALLARMVVSAPRQLMPVIRQRLQDSVMSLQKEFGVDNKQAADC